MLVFIIILLLVLVVYVLFRAKHRHSGKEKEKDSETDSTKGWSVSEGSKSKSIVNKTPEKSKTLVHYADDFKTEKTITTKDGLHEVKTFLMFKDKIDVWTCEACEAENLTTKTVCCLCGSRREGA